MHRSTYTFPRVIHKERPHSHFLPLNQFTCYFLKSLASLIHPSIHPSNHPTDHPACLDWLLFLAASLQSCHRESQLYESLLFFPNLSMAERMELALLQIHRPPLACLCPEKSLLIVTTDSMPTHTPHQPNKPQRLSPLWLSSDPTQPCMYLLRCKFKLFVWPLFSICQRDIRKCVKGWTEEETGSKQVAVFKDECCSRNLVVLQRRCPPASSIPDRKWRAIDPRGGYFEKKIHLFLSSSWLGNAELWEN